jgi:hypothetical protein
MKTLMGTTNNVKSGSEMSEQQSPSRKVKQEEPVAVTSAISEKAQKPTPQSPPSTALRSESTQLKNREDTITTLLNEMEENAGQISELAKEEENLVTEFFNFMFKILKPFSKTIEISSSSLPEHYRGQIDKSYLYLTGQLVLVHTNGELEILNLTDQENHDVLVEITEEIMTKLKIIINTSRSKIEKRVKFLLTITKELQKVAKVFSEQWPMR